MPNAAPSVPFAVERVVPGLSACLAALERAPGKDEAWVVKTTHILQRVRPAVHERLGRRLSFALALADLSSLDHRKRAALAIGVFFHELAEEGAEQEPSRPWTDYLLRNMEWLAAGFSVVESIRSKDWRTLDDGPSGIAKIALAFDEEIVEHHTRPLQIMKSITEANLPGIDRIIAVLRSEQGQALCDIHFRRDETYDVNTFEILKGMRVLKPEPSQPVADAPPASPQRFSRPRRPKKAPPAQQTISDLNAPPPQQTIGDLNAPPAQPSIGGLTEPPPPAPAIDAPLLEQFEALRSQLAGLRREAKTTRRIPPSLSTYLDEIASWLAELELMAYALSNAAEEPEHEQAA